MEITGSYFQLLQEHAIKNIDNNFTRQIQPDENFPFGDPNLYAMIGALVASVITYLSIPIVLLYREQVWMSTKGRGGCFAPSTSIWMADGSEKTIQAIAVGDQVLGETRWGARVASAVVKLFVHDGSHETLIINNSLVLTPNHPVMIKRFGFLRTWVEARHLRVGNILVGVSGNVRLNTIALSERLATVYNLEVEKTLTYFARGILVHNKS